MADIASKLPVQDAADGVDGTAVPTISTLIAGKDANGNLQSLATDINGQTFDIANVSSQFRSITVSTTAVQALGGTSTLANRKFIVITPLSGEVFWGTSSSVTTSSGFPLFANQTLTLSFGTNIQVFLISTVSTSVMVLEAS